ncbi:hypothetical protein KJ567_02370 [Candidatus Bipolaricaulota bacterium]|nr:hypothetical protein [Candidatus Bipolaricaulota bacterium]
MTTPFHRTLGRDRVLGRAIGRTLRALFVCIAAGLCLLTVGCEPENPSREWLVMLYMGAGDADIDERLFWDLAEAEQIGSSEKVTIVAQFDPFDGSNATESTSAKRYLVTQDDCLYTVGSEVLEDLGEVDMTDPDVLQSFVGWAIETYPAKRRMLVLGGHGAGWRGVLNDDSSGTESMMSLPELQTSLASALRQCSVNRLDLLGFSACLMGQIEVLTALEPHACYVVASECIECAFGWGYAGFLDELIRDPSMSTCALAGCIVENHISGDAFVANETARVIADLQLYCGPLSMQQIQSISRMTHLELINTCERFDVPYEWIPTATQKAQQADAHTNRATIAAYDLSALRDVYSGIRRLSSLLADLDEAELRAIWDACRGEDRSCWTCFDYVDLPCLASLMQPKCRALDQLVRALDRLILRAKRGSAVERLSGLSIYFPCFGGADTSCFPPGRDLLGLGAYPKYARSFVERTEWDRFLNAIQTSCQRSESAATSSKHAE